MCPGGVIAQHFRVCLAIAVEYSAMASSVGYHCGPCFQQRGSLMPIDERWNQLDASDWDAFAQSWIAELRGTPSDSEANVGQSVVMMNFTARPEHQWQFILAAIAHASDDELGHIAAGPMEHLLGKHGDKYLEKVEQRAEADPRFARMLAGVWKYMMSDHVWARVEALKAKYPATPK